MTKTTMFAAQPFEAGKRGKVLAGVPMEARDAEHAERIAKRMSFVKLGAIAFSTEVEIESGDAEPPVMIASFGAVPEGVLEPV